MGAQWADIIHASAGIRNTGTPTPTTNAGSVGFSTVVTKPGIGEYDLTLAQPLDESQGACLITLRTPGLFPGKSASYQRPDDSTIRVILSPVGSPDDVDFDILVIRGLVT